MVAWTRRLEIESSSSTHTGLRTHKSSKSNKSNKSAKKAQDRMNVKNFLAGSKSNSKASSKKAAAGRKGSSKSTGKASRKLLNLSAAVRDASPIETSISRVSTTKSKASKRLDSEHGPTKQQSPTTSDKEVASIGAANRAPSLSRHLMKNSNENNKRTKSLASGDPFSFSKEQSMASTQAEHNNGAQALSHGRPSLSPLAPLREQISAARMGAIPSRSKSSSIAPKSSRRSRNRPTTSGSSFSDQTYTLGEQNDLEPIKSLALIANRNYDEGQYERALATYKRMLELVNTLHKQKQSSDQKIVNANKNLGGEADDKIHQKQSADILFQMGKIHEEMGDIVTALTEYCMSIQLYQYYREPQSQTKAPGGKRHRVKDTKRLRLVDERIGLVLSRMAKIHLQLRKFDSALEISEIALCIFQDLRFRRRKFARSDHGETSNHEVDQQIAALHTTIAEIHTLRGDYDDAKKVHIASTSQNQEKDMTVAAVENERSKSFISRFFGAVRDIPTTLASYTYLFDGPTDGDIIGEIKDVPNYICQCKVLLSDDASFDEDQDSVADATLDTSYDGTLDSRIEAIIQVPTMQSSVASTISASTYDSNASDEETEDSTYCSSAYSPVSQILL